MFFLFIAVFLSFNDFDIVQPVEGQGQILQGEGQAGAMDIGHGPAVLGALDVGVLQNIVLFVHHRLLAPDEQQGIVIVQRPNLVGCEQFTTAMSSDELKKVQPHRFCVAGLFEISTLVKPIAL